MKIGAKIRRLRKLRGLTIEELANNAELTKGFISQLERDITAPSVLNLKQVVEVLGVDLATFFSDLEETERNIYTKKDRIGEAVEKNFKIERLIPKLKYLEMEPVLLTVNPLVTYKTNFEEDEGFGFVLKGRVELTVESECNKLNRGGCFYVFFDNKIIIKNLANKPAEILFVYY